MTLLEEKVIIKTQFQKLHPNKMKFKILKLILEGLDRAVQERFVSSKQTNQSPQTTKTK